VKLIREVSLTFRYGKLWEDIRADSLVSLLWNPIEMFLKVFYVMDIMFF